MWQKIESAPFDRKIELAVIDRDGEHVLVFPCRQIQGGWVKFESQEPIDVRPSHWRAWEEKS